jgi:hypothetical protein
MGKSDKKLANYFGNDDLDVTRIRSLLLQLLINNHM